MQGRVAIRVALEDEPRSRLANHLGQLFVAPLRTDVQKGDAVGVRGGLRLGALLQQKLRDVDVPLEHGEEEGMDLRFVLQVEHFFDVVGLCVVHRDRLVLVDEQLDGLERLLPRDGRVKRAACLASVLKQLDTCFVLRPVNDGFDEVGLAGLTGRHEGGPSRCRPEIELVGMPGQYVLKRATQALLAHQMHHVYILAVQVRIPLEMTQLGISHFVALIVIIVVGFRREDQFEHFSWVHFDQDEHLLVEFIMA